MGKTRQGLVEHCYNKLGTPYLFGAKVEKVDQKLIAELTQENPSVYTSAYIAKAKKLIGKVCIDCSGLISWYTGIVRGSYDYMETAIAKYSFSQLDESMIGYGLWRQGHIAVYVGDGYCIEAKSIDIGTVKTKVSASSWIYVLKLKDIDYSVSSGMTGWVQDSNGYQYLENGLMVTGWKYIDNIWYYFLPSGYPVVDEWHQDDNHWYYFNPNGTVHYGWLRDTDDSGNVDWYYLDKDGIPEGAMAVGLKYLQWNADFNYYYFLPENGKMVVGAWYQEGTIWRYFNMNGTMQTGWLDYKGRRYHLDSSGILQVGMTSVDGAWYLLNPGQLGDNTDLGAVLVTDSNGVLSIGMTNVSQATSAEHVIKPKIAVSNEVLGDAETDKVVDNGTGQVKNGWYDVDSYQEYWNDGRRIENDWYKDGENWYYFDEKGRMYTGWLTYRNRYYYLNPSGVMQTGMTNVSDKWYFFNLGAIGDNTDYGALLVTVSNQTLAVLGYRS